MFFEDRESAARQLVGKLSHYRGKNPLIAGIPRGAMPMAKIIADALGGELGAVLVHKIPAPESEEFAIGSVGISGHIHRQPYVEEEGIPETYIQSAAQKQLQVLKERKKKYGLTEPNFKDRIVIIVDDGVATGATAIAAIHEVRAQSPKKIVFAAGVTAPKSGSEIRRLVDEFVVLSEPPILFSVGEFFENFPTVTDEQVAEIFRESRARKEKVAEQRL
ncbi:MAG: phosphoribosyltransferase [Bdellovibrionales bacterium]